MLAKRPGQFDPKILIFVAFGWCIIKAIEWVQRYAEAGW